MPQSFCQFHPGIRPTHDILDRADLPIPRSSLISEVVLDQNHYEIVKRRTAIPQWQPISYIGHADRRRAMLIQLCSFANTTPTTIHDVDHTPAQQSNRVWGCCGIGVFVRLRDDVDHLRPASVQQRTTNFGSLQHSWENRQIRPGQQCCRLVVDMGCNTSSIFGRGLRESVEYNQYLRQHDVIRCRS